MEQQRAPGDKAGEIDRRIDRAISSALYQRLSDAQWLPVSSLLPADSPRLEGEDVEHTRMLAKIDANLPPIVVHRPTMRVVDGTHRLGAALLRGEEMIQVRFFDGSEHEAFVLAVQTNVTHGLPLSLADRSKATQRIIASNPDWSDRAIASAVGLGPRTVGNIRQRIRAKTGIAEVTARTGRDGRVRPLNAVDGRLRVVALLEQRPDASLREIARQAGVSPSTVRDVRGRVARGEDPAPQARRRRRDDTPTEPGARPAADGQPLAALLQGLQNDPSLRFTDSGRTILRWIFSHAIRAEDRVDVAANIPPHCRYIIADVARTCAEEWLQLASELEERINDHV